MIYGRVRVTRVFTKVYGKRDDSRVMASIGLKVANGFLLVEMEWCGVTLILTLYS